MTSSYLSLSLWNDCGQVWVFWIKGHSCLWYRLWNIESIFGVFAILSYHQIPISHNVTMTLVLGIKSDITEPGTHIKSFKLVWSYIIHTTAESMNTNQPSNWYHDIYIYHVILWMDMKINIWWQYGNHWYFHTDETIQWHTNANLRRYVNERGGVLKERKW